MRDAWPVACASKPTKPLFGPESTSDAGQAMDAEVREYLVISRGQWDADASPQDVQRAIDDFYVWLDRNIDLKKMRMGSRLKPEGKLVSRSSVTDGPFAETKELIGGFWFILAGSLDEAAQLAAKNPCMAYGLSYEIRPLEPQKAVVGTFANETPAAWHRGTATATSGSSARR
jgi:hypothetical protein